MPCLNEEDVLPSLFSRLSVLEAELASSGRINGRLEVVCVDDGSVDRTWEMITSEHGTLRVRGVRLARNHGHQRALLAGLLQAQSDVVISMDADLQDDPAAIPEMIDRYQDGAEIVYGVRASRDSDTHFKRLTARAYYSLMSRLGVELVPDHADFRLMSRKALQSLAKFDEENLFLRGLVPLLGYRQDTVSYNRPARLAGESKYPLSKMLGLAIEGITSLSVAPLRIIVVTGFLIAAMAFGYIFHSILIWSMGGTVPGWTSIVVPIYFLGGAHLVALGIIGEYVGKIYKETKRRPRFIIDEVVNETATQGAGVPLRLAK